MKFVSEVGMNCNAEKETLFFVSQLSNIITLLRK